MSLKLCLIIRHSPEFHPAGRDLAAGFRKVEADPLVGHPGHFRLHQEEFSAVGDQKILETKRRQEPFDVGDVAPDAVEPVAAAREGFCREGDGAAVSDVLESDEDGAVLEIEVVEFIDQAPFADTLPVLRVVVVAAGR